MPYDPKPYFERHLIEECRDDELLGWLDYRLGTGGIVEIVNIEVANAHRRTGVGRKLLARLLVELPRDVKCIYAFTSGLNAIAQAWYQKMGFRLELLEDFYESMDEHAYVCWKVLK